jgi:hypothetical protein
VLHFSRIHQPASVALEICRDTRCRVVLAAVRTRRCTDGRRRSRRPQMQGSNSTNLFPKPPVIGNLAGPVRRDTKVQRTPQVILCRANICIENVATVSRGQQLAGEGFGLTQPRAAGRSLGGPLHAERMFSHVVGQECWRSDRDGVSGYLGGDGPVAARNDGSMSRRPAAFAMAAPSLSRLVTPQRWFVWFSVALSRLTGL